MERGHGGNGGGVDGAPRRFGARQGVEAVGGKGGGEHEKQQQQQQLRQEREEEEGGGGVSDSTDGMEGGGSASAPLVGKGEALTLDKLPWRL